MKPLARRAVVVGLVSLIWGFPGHAPAQGASTPSDPPDQEYDLPFSGACGLVTRYSSSRINPACLVEAQNIDLDEDLTWSRRRGQAEYNAQGCSNLKSVRGLWPFDTTDNNHYLIIFSSQSFFSTLGSGDCNQLSASTFSATAPMNCAQGLGKLVCTNGHDYPVSFNNNLTSHTITSMPKGELIGFFRNRFLTSKVATAQTRVYGSGEGSETDWTIQIPGRSTTAFSLDMAGTHDGKGVSCLMGEYQNAYFVGRNDDLFAIYGNDRRDFSVRKISGQVGCIEAKSPKEKNNALYWVSKRGVEKLSGTSITRVSDPIRDTIDEILVAAGNTVSVEDTTQADFLAGNVTASGPGAPISTVIFPGAITPSSWTATDTSGADFSLWASSSNVSTMTISGSLTLEKASGTFTNGGFQNATGSACNQNMASADWTTTKGQWKSGPCQLTVNFSGPLDGVLGTTQRNAMSACSDSDLGPNVAIVDANDVLISSAGPYAALTQDSFDLSLVNVPLVKVRVRIGATQELFSRTFNKPKVFKFIAGTSGNDFAGDTCGGGQQAAFFDAVEGEIYATTGGNIVSRTFDTAFSTPIGGSFVVSMTSAADSALAMQIQQSSDGTAWDALASISPSAKVTLQKRYWRYKPSFTNPTCSTCTAILHSVSLSAATSGYFIGQCRNPGATVTSWNQFSCGIAGGGTIAAYISTGTTCNSVTRSTANWVAQINNSVPAIATGAFVSYRLFFDIDSPTQAPTAQYCAISWNEGSDRADVVAEVYRDRYYLYYTTSTASGSYNDHAVVLDQNDKWTVYDGVNAASVATYKNQLFIGDSKATGKLYIQDVGYDDFGSAFTMRFRTADLDFGDPTRPKSFKSLYVMMRSEEDPTQDIPVTFRYRIDGATTTYSLGSCNMDEAAEVGYFVCKLPFSVDEAVDARWLSVEAEYSGSQGPVRIFGMKFIYSNKERD